MELAGPEISGFRVSGFRTLSEAELVCDGRLTVVCGPNNAGKSSLLEALLRYPACLSAVSGQKAPKESPTSFGSGSVEAGIGIPVIGGPLERLWEEQDHPLEAFIPIAEALCGQLGDDRIWVPIVDTGGKLQPETSHPDGAIRDAVQAAGVDEPRFMRFMHKLAGGRRQPFEPTKQWFKSLVQRLSMPDIAHIPDVRRAADEPLSPEELGVLARDSSLRADGSRQSAWTETLGDILKDTFGQDVEYHVPPRGNSGAFQLNIDGETDIDLSEVGAGVREVVAVTYKALHAGRGTVLLIEEPENCLHPMAVRRLLWSLVDRADLQVIATTHSAAVIDANPSSVVQVSRSGTETRVKPVANTADRFEAIRSLGYSPADVVLAPCAVWVEGPSDRIYLHAWLGSHELVEGVDYQIMFYGGALGEHVSAEMDPPNAQAAAIRALSRRCVIVADSDRRKSRAKHKRHVRRWRDETKGDPNAHLWVTPGREVENLLPLEVINEYRASKRRKRLTEETKRFGGVFDGIKRPDKVALARRVVQADPSPPPDARKEVGRIAHFIQESRDRTRSP